ncbi:hypothetical protein ADIS_4059 [Lunatimonas lonarensis]|uniref:DUF4397 domain-containing protein n=1 Tax=Lunatimonas lonarensis TaxID=1232681 RepID=R7ZMM7_9BACT|nr:DUF4397 domain-containing protein [Lunatimonas lonarensis]EON75355.1 hypothetical protein ADIS_4059 [Lunatimonas lonarensis]
MNIEKRANLSRVLKRITVAVMIVSAAGLSSCLNETEMPEMAPIAFVSFYHGSPQTDQLTITVDNRVYNSNPFRFGNYFDYGNFYTGSRNFSFRNPGASSSLLDTLVTLKASETYSVFLADHQELFKTIIVKDKLENPGPGKALLRIAHLSPDTPAVNLVIGNAAQPVIEEQSFGEISDYKAIDAGRFNLAIREADGSGATLVVANETSVLAGRIYTLVIRGYSEHGQGTENRLSLQMIRNYPNY